MNVEMLLMSGKVEMEPIFLESLVWIQAVAANACYLNCEPLLGAIAPDFRQLGKTSGSRLISPGSSVFNSTENPESGMRWYHLQRV